MRVPLKRKFRKMAKILITGTAGFIGFHLAKSCVKNGHNVVGLDNINDYYDKGLKYGRLAETGILESQIKYNHLVCSSKYEHYSFIQLDLEDENGINELFKQHQFDHVINLAAQAGVRYSINNPSAYVGSNIVGFLNILEGCRNYRVRHLIYASSSSIYGLNKEIPFTTSQMVDSPVSIYAASKKSNELMAHAYSHLFNLSTTGLRFFTVYGPWGRPDMALFSFVKNIIEGQPIEIFNEGDLMRDFTYIDDIVNGIVNVLNKKNSSTSDASTLYSIYNIGNNSPIKLLDFVSTIEKSLGMKAIKVMKEMQPGDMNTTYADVTDLIRDFDYAPGTKLDYGVQKFVEWYKTYYNIET